MAFLCVLASLRLCVRNFSERFSSKIGTQHGGLKIGLEEEEFNAKTTRRIPPLRLSAFA